MSLRICTSCGAPLGGNKCEYCGHPPNEAGFTAFFEQDRAVGTLTIGGDEYKVYLGAVDVAPRVEGWARHKFTLVEL